MQRTSSRTESEQILHQDHCQGLKSPERSRHWSCNSCHSVMSPDSRSDSASGSGDGPPRPTTDHTAAGDDDEDDGDDDAGGRAAAADADAAVDAASADPVHPVADCGGAGDAVAADHSGDPFP